MRRSSSILVFVVLTSSYVYVCRLHAQDGTVKVAASSMVGSNLTACAIKAVMWFSAESMVRYTEGCQNASGVVVQLRRVVTTVGAIEGGEWEPSLAQR